MGLSLNKGMGAVSMHMACSAIGIILSMPSMSRTAARRIRLAPLCMHEDACMQRACPLPAVPRPLDVCAAHAMCTARACVVGCMHAWPQVLSG